jgi:hypothetical protein
LSTIVIAVDLKNVPKLTNHLTVSLPMRSQSLPSGGNKSNKRKKDTHSPDKVDVNDTKKSKVDSASYSPSKT